MIGLGSLAALAGVMVFALFAGTLFIFYYNALVRLRRQVERAWANIDVVLKQRSDEIPALVSVVRQFALHERATIDRVMKAREAYQSASSVGAKVAAATDMGSAVRGLLALGEAYPELRSSQNFLQLQERLSALESVISDRRELFNSAATNLNTRMDQIPDRFFAGILGYEHVSLFRATPEEMKRPDIDLKLSA